VGAAVDRGVNDEPARLGDCPLRCNCTCLWCFCATHSSALVLVSRSRRVSLSATCDPIQPAAAPVRLSPGRAPPMRLCTLCSAPSSPPQLSHRAESEEARWQRRSPPLACSRPTTDATLNQPTTSATQPGTHRRRPIIIVCLCRALTRIAGLTPADSHGGPPPPVAAG
jgi:hypothetical protein